MFQSKWILTRLYFDYHVISNDFYVDISLSTFRSTRPDGVVKSRCSENYKQFLGKQLERSLIWLKFQVLSVIYCLTSSWTFSLIFKKSIFQNISGWLFLHIEIDWRVDYCSNNRLGLNLYVIVEYGIKNYFLLTIPWFYVVFLLKWKAINFDSRQSLRRKHHIFLCCLCQINWKQSYFKSNVIKPI